MRSGGNALTAGSSIVISIAIVLSAVAAGPVAADGDAGVTAAGDLFRVEGDADLDGDGATGAAEDGDGDEVYGSIDAAVGNATVDATVRVGAGTYEERVTVPTSVRLVADGEVILDGLGDGGVGITVETGAAGTVVDGVTIRRYDRGIRVNARDVVVRNATVQATGGNTLYVAGDNVTVVDATLEEPGGRNVQVVDGDVATFRRVTVTDANGAGLYVGGLDTLTVRNSTFRGNGNGVRAENVGTVTVTGSLFESNGNRGLRVDGTETFGRTVRVRNTTVVNSGDSGIRVEATDGDDAVTVVDSTLRGNGNQNLETHGGVESVTVRDVTTTEANNAGVRVGSAQSVAVENVTARLNGRRGLRLRGADTADTFAVRNSTLTDNNNNGLRVSARGGDGDTVTIRNVDASGSGDSGGGSQDAVRVEGAESVDVRDSLAGSAGVDGLSIDRSDQAPTDVTVVNVTARGVGGDAVYVERGGSVAVRDVQVSTGDGGRDGVHVDRASSVTVANVTSRLNNRRGVYLGGSDGDDTVVVRDVDLTDNENNAVRIEAGGGSDTATLSGVAANGSGDGGGGNQDAVRVEGTETVEVRTVTVESPGVSGLSILPGDQSTVAATVENYTARNVRQEAIYVSRATGLTVRNVSVVDTANRGIQSVGTGVSGRTTTFENVSVVITDNRGISLAGTEGEDSLTMRNVTVEATGTNFRGNPGIEVERYESVTIRDTNSSGNGGDGLSLSATGDVSVRRAAFVDNGQAGVEVDADATPGETDVHEATIGGNDGPGVRVRGPPAPSNAVNATRVYWGNGTGPGSATDAVLEDPATAEPADGGGDEVTASGTGGVAAVRFDPFLESPPGTAALFAEPLPDTGAVGPPTDPDGDGLYEDVDGDGEAAFDDAVDLGVVVALGPTGDDLTADQRAALDFDGDGDFDFDDAIELAFQA
jgi:hypothetical protein